MRRGEDRRVEAAIHLLKASDRPTAVIAYEYSESMAIVRAALMLGLKIPSDLSLIQFHNRVDDRAFIPIHTVCNMMTEIGDCAVGMLLEKIACPEVAQRSRR